MKFNSVKAGLKWFYRREYYRKPLGAKSLDFLKVHTTYRTPNFEAEIETYIKIQRIIDLKLKPKECYILHHEFRRNGKNQRDIAQQFNLSSDRRVREIKSRAMKKLKAEFQEHGLLSTPRYEVPVYVRE